jgi:hypothetical protein
MAKNEREQDDGPAEKEMGIDELLETAALKLEHKRGPRAPKTYQGLADEIRAIAAKLAAL